MRAGTVPLARHYLTYKLKCMRIWMSMQPDVDLEAMALFTAETASEIVDFALCKLGHEVPNRLPPDDKRNRTTRLARKTFHEGRGKPGRPRKIRETEDGSAPQSA